MFTEMYLIAFFVLIGLIALTIDAKKYAMINNVTNLFDDSERRIYIASGMTDNEYKGSKILMIMYSIYCRKCNGQDVYVELSDESKSLDVYCKSCGYVSRIKLEKLVVKQEPINHRKSEE